MFYFIAAVIFLPIICYYPASAEGAIGWWDAGQKADISGHMLFSVMLRLSFLTMTYYPCHDDKMMYGVLLVFSGEVLILPVIFRVLTRTF